LRQQGGEVSNREAKRETAKVQAALQRGKNRKIKIKNKNKKQGGEAGDGQSASSTRARKR